MQEEQTAASLAPAQPDAKLTEQAVSAMPAWHAYRAGLRQKGYFKVAFCFAFVPAGPLQLLPRQSSQEFAKHVHPSASIYVKVAPCILESG